MEEHLYLEVEVNEALVSYLNRKHPGSEPPFLINTLKELLEEKMGGILCQVHFHLPVCHQVYSNHRWVVHVISCCPDHLYQLVERLPHLFDMIE